MADIPPPPAGYTLDSAVPPPPPGYTLDKSFAEKTEPEYSGVHGAVQELGSMWPKSVTPADIALIPAAIGGEGLAMKGVQTAGNAAMRAFPKLAQTVAESQDVRSLSRLSNVVGSGAAGWGGAGTVGGALDAKPGERLKGAIEGGKEGAKMGAEFGPVGELAGKVIPPVAKAIAHPVETANKVIKKSDADAYIIKELQKAGHSIEDIVEIANRAKEHGMTIGEASNNPAILGMERKISGMNNPGGETVRDFVKNRVDPTNNVSVPFKLKSMADPLVKEVNKASKAIGSIVESAPKTPINMNKVASSLLSEKRPPGSAVTNTLDRIDALVEWAKQEGNTFAAWHRVKQDIFAIGKEASDPNAINKLDKKTVAEYYNKVNDVLSGRTAGLPEDLTQTGAKYARENNNFHQNLAGRTIEDALKAMPTGGTPASSLKFLYKALADNKEMQEELFEGMPESERAGMMKFLEAIKDSGRAGVSDVVKSMEQGSPSFPLTKSQALHKAYASVSDFLTRKDYNGLGKALTSPDVEQLAKKLGYIKPEPVPKPILRLTYQPEKPDIFVGRDEQAIVGNEKTTAAAKAIRDRMEKLGYGPGVLRAQDLNVIRDMETKYGQSELGKFMIEHKNEPIMGRIWDVPQTEYSQATVDKMMGKDAMSRLTKLDKTTRDSIDSETRTAWDSHKVPLADMILARRQAAKELSAAIGKPDEVGSVGNAMMDAISRSNKP